MPDTGECRSCGAAMLWVEMRDSGKRNPLNPEPDPERGNVLILRDRAPIGLAVALGPADAERERGSGTDLYLSHFATCPNRTQHRKS